MDFSMGAGGPGFMPTGLDAFNAILSRIPGYMEEAQLRKRRKGEEEYLRGQDERKVRDIELRQLRRATGPQMGSAPREAFAGPSKEEQLQRALVQARVDKLRNLQAMYGGPQATGGTLGSTALGELYTPGG